MTVANTNPLEMLLRCSKAEGECILWTGTIRPSGHGVFKLRGRAIPAHRISYKLAYPELDLEKPKRLVVRHLCTNPACINPSHLTHGHQSENIQDMMEGRGQGRLSPKDIYHWKELRLRGWTVTDIAKLYKRDNSTVWHALHGNSWRHLFDPLPTYGRGKPYRNRPEA